VVDERVTVGRGGTAVVEKYREGETGMALNTGLDWLLDDLTQRISSVRHALVLSNDGLVTGSSQSLERQDAEHLAAVSSGLHSLARGSGEHFRAGQVRQTMIEFEEGLLFVTAAGDGSCLCVLTGAEADIGQVAYEMTLLVNRVGEHLALSARNGG
jgi:predicted regulator of Ras-like GTPase activity (Roadblock/LC7/MglB family)